MNPLRPALIWLLLAGAAAVAQNAPLPGRPGGELLPLSPGDSARRTAEELEQLVAPIALYPDALIALILPASTVPADVVLAARQLRESGDNRSQIEHRAWDESVKSLTHYPDVLKWMDDNLQWTKQLGEAFLAQPAEVMQAVQRLRAKARAEGRLVDTPQQQVLTDLEIIRIVPAQANAIYVPYYEPATFFLAGPVMYGRPPLFFGVGLPVGSWLAFECDWRRHTIWMGDRHRRWSGHDWRQPIVPIPIAAPAYARHPEVRPWQPPAYPPRHPRSTPPSTSSHIVRAYPPSAPASRFDPPHVPTYGHSGPPRRERPDAAPTGVNPRPAGPNLAPALGTAPFARIPPGPPPPESTTPPPANTVRRAPPPTGRVAGTNQSENPPPRRHPPESRAVSPAPTSVVTAPSAQAPRHVSRPAPAAPATVSSTPPAAAGPRSAPPAPTRPQTAPASTPAAAPAAAPARTEVESERTVGRRSINER
jgi:hypothetical protein